MNRETFFQLADQTVSNNPYDRLPGEIREALENRAHDVDQILIDVHVHCFTLRHVPRKFIGPEWIRFRPILWTIEAVLKIAADLTKLLKGKGSEYYSTFAKRRFLTRFTLDKSSEDVFRAYYRKVNFFFYRLLGKPRPPHLIACQLMMDMERGIEGGAPKPFYRQLEELSNLRDIRRNRAMILPFLALDPRNPNLYADFLAVFSDPAERVNQTGEAFLDTAFPFFGVKLYPSLGYLPSHPVLMDIFKVCAAKKIPVTSHCGGASVRFSGNKIQGEYLLRDQHTGNLVPATFKEDFSQYPKKQRGDEIAKFFNAPYNWIAVTETYPDLKINLAHFAGSDQWQVYRDHQGAVHTHVHETLAMVEKYPNVFADISYAYATHRNIDRLYDMLYGDTFPEEQRKIYREKFLHGSDFYMTEQEKHIATILKNLFEKFSAKREQLNRICIENPIRFLLG